MNCNYWIASIKSISFYRTVESINTILCVFDWFCSRHSAYHTRSFTWDWRHCVLEIFGHKSLSFMKAPTDQEHRLKQLSWSTLKDPSQHHFPISHHSIIPTLSSAQSLPLFQPLTQVGGDEGQQSSNASIDAGLAGQGTAIAPRNKANKLAVCVDDRTAAVTLARVLATCGQTGAEHVVGDLSDAVVLAAGCARDDGDVDLAQRGGGGAARAGGAPAGNGGDGSCGGV